MTSPFSKHSKIESRYQNPASIIDFLDEFNMFGSYSEGFLLAKRRKETAMREKLNNKNKGN